MEVNKMLKNQSTEYRIGGMTTSEVSQAGDKITPAEQWRQDQAASADERHRPIIDAYLSGMKYREIAQQFNITIARVGHIIGRARDRNLISMTSRPKTRQQNSSIA